MNQNRTQLKHNRAFTLIELMIAIGVIVLLAGILFIAGKSVTSNAATQATKVSMASLNGMFGEFDAKTRLARAPTAYRWYYNGVAVNVPTLTGDPLPAGVDFWRVPYLNGTVIDSLDAPGLVEDTTPATRFASRQIINTQLVMNFLLSMPNNRAAIQNLTADHYMLLEYQSGDVPAPGADGVLYTSGDNTETIFYMPGNRVVYNGQRFLKTSTNQITPVAGGDWAVDTSQPSPILVDGWHNPIIFVPGSGLRVRLLNGAKDYTDTVNVKTMIIVSPEGKVDYSNPLLPRVTQPGRPFWASAGPDGDFAKGDDNIYSFAP